MPRVSTDVTEIEDLLAMKQAPNRARVRVGKDVLDLNNLNKIYFPESGYTKLDLMRYYYAVRATILPYLKGRPLILKRYPDGIEGEMFYQHDLKNAPDIIETVRIPSETRGFRDYALVSDPGDLLYLVGIGTIAENPMHSRITSRDHPDYFVFDLDPMDNASFDDVRTLALEVKKVLDAIGLACYPKTSGSSGIHVYVPIKPQYSYDEVVDFAKGVAELVVRAQPDKATIIRWVRKRNPRHVYVDYLQNLNGKSIAAAYSVREKPRAPVSAPLEWKEVAKKFEITDFTIKNMPARIAKKGDLFKPVLQKKQTLAAARKKLKALLAEG